MNHDPINNYRIRLAIIFLADKFGISKYVNLVLGGIIAIASELVEQIECVNRLMRQPSRVYRYL
jgi:hypothetical protein